jgi:hypothetical protein
VCRQDSEPDDGFAHMTQFQKEMEIRRKWASFWDVSLTLLFVFLYTAAVAAVTLFLAKG